MSLSQELLKQIYISGTKLLKKKLSRYDWDVNSRDSQKIPQWDWRIWLLLAGRGFGKTRTGSEAIRSFVDQGYKNICLLGKNKEEVRKIMIEGESGILSVYPDHEKPQFYPSQNVLKWKNGAIAQIHSADSYESLRGPQFDLAWVDELAKFSNLNETWDQLMMTMRLGIPKIIVTTTPKPIQKLHNIMSRKDTHCTRGSTMENEKNLAKEYMDYINNEYANTEFGKQEIYGELLDKVSMWSHKNISYKQIELNQLSQIIIAIDPAVTSHEKSDETGIIVLGKAENEIFILEDRSGKWKMSDFSSICVELCNKYKTKEVVAEINQGGDMVEQMIKMEDSTIQFHPVRSMNNKTVRAQSVVCFYDQKKVFHCEKFDILEEQMRNFPCIAKSPDRVDALVIGVNYLNKRKNEVAGWFLNL